MHSFDYLFPCSLSLYFQHVCCLTFLNSNELTCLCMSLLVNISKRSVHFIYFCYCSLVIKSCLTLCNTWTVACQAPLSMGFPRQEYWSGLSFPSPQDLSWPRNRTRVSCIAGRFFTNWATLPNIMCKDFLNHQTSKVTFYNVHF